MNRIHAIVGWSIEDATRDLQKSLTQWQPDVVLLHIGTNNMVGRKELDKLPRKMQHIMEMVAATCPDAVLVVAQITPIAFRNDEVKEFNRGVERIVEERAAAGKRVLSVDMYEAFEYPGHPDYLLDVAHPNENGYEVMAKVWAEGLGRANSLGWLR